MAPSLSQPRTVLALAAAILLTAFLIPRLPYILSYRLPLGAPDTLTYAWPMLKLERGDAPSFELRTPGYPMFWWLCRRITANPRFVVFAQLGATLAAAIGALAAVARVAPRYVIWTGFGLALFVSSPIHVLFDLYLLSESLFASLLLAYAAALLLALHRPSPAAASAAAVAGSLAILVRPNGVFVLPALLVAAAWTWWRTRRRNTVAAFLLPPTVLLGSLVAYNAATIGRPVLSAGGPWAMLWSTSVYVTPDPSLPGSVNAAIARKDSLLSPADRDVLRGSSSPRAIQTVIERYIWDAIVPIVAAIGKGPAPEAAPYLEGLPLFEQVSETAIRNNPRVRRLNVLGAFALYHSWIGRSATDQPLSVVAARQYRDTYVAPQPYMTQIAQLYSLPAPPGYQVSADTGRTVRAPLGTASRLESLWSRVHVLVTARSRLWVATLYAGLAVAVVVFARSRGRSANALCALLLASAVVGNGVVLSAFGHIERRYGYPLDFVSYLFLALTPALLIDWRRHRRMRLVRANVP
jgi:hypothetical protein